MMFFAIMVILFVAEMMVLNVLMVLLRKIIITVIVLVMVWNILVIVLIVSLMVLMLGMDARNIFVSVFVPGAEFLSFGAENRVPGAENQSKKMKSAPQNLKRALVLFAYFTFGVWI